jgi:hypothetical protein
MKYFGAMKTLTVQEARFGPLVAARHWRRANRHPTGSIHRSVAAAFNPAEIAAVAA